MSSSGLIYAVIVGAWAAYLVPMWLRRQDELNEARPTERFSTAIRLLSGRAGMERRYARDLRARSASEGEQDAGDPDAATDSVDVRAFAMPPTRRQVRAEVEPEAPGRQEPAHDQAVAPAAKSPSTPPRQAGTTPASAPVSASTPAPKSGSAPARKQIPAPRRAPSAQAAAERARRSKALARRRRTTVMLFVAFTLGAIVAAVGGLAFLWAPGVPAVMLSAYIAYLRAQERRRFAYQMDRRQAEAAAQRLRERQPRRRAPLDPAGVGADEPEEGPETGTDPGLSALAADRRALVEQTDHAEWVDQQRERQRRPGHGDSWDPVPVPLPTYVTAPVAPRATSDVDLGAPDAWSSARSSAVAPEQESTPAAPQAEAEEAGPADDDQTAPADDRTDARRAASARRARERGRTPLFDQYEDGDRPRAANE
ncbi:gephyrin-like molybdotransferase receptor GlpR [Streptomyces sp. NPDC001980]|uniref:divisome protein SepX/GlpR n=1 Tax=Streptomyces sp. NPDC001980 TaxID=3157126 RepID=UPI00331A30CA